MNTLSPFRNFDPRQVAHYEVENYVAYYLRQWPRLLTLTVGLVKHAFGLPSLKAIQGAYLVARAEMAAAPVPDNDIPKAEAYMIRFYELLKRQYPEERFDPAQAARLDVRWWVVHRELFANPDNQPLVDAVADLWAYAYDLPRERVIQAAQYRVNAMLISDRWVRAGRDPNSPMLREEKEEMECAYVALREAVSVPSTAAIAIA
jgi:hypothetical protein